MEWDRVTATDIYVLLSSFKPPPPAAILSVTIYLSDFGKERLKEEEETGPKLRNLTKSIEDESTMDNKTREALRAYQLDTMRYYYAIIICDSEKTASTIYENCDGVEFESSAIRMDLRFVPDEMTFEVRYYTTARKTTFYNTASEDTVNINVFKPKIFESVALSKSSAKLTWDETDPERLKAMRESFDQNADLDQFEYSLIIFY
uniref:ADF-H domain-containing protein n=1 Tax=Syphacia muris TaxID=451379 RepID=A0A0N5AUT4_9BILA